ncbi:hypothetical protein VIN01S_31000 [Vibrio inusitatus NBRC 102082]|uniref:Transferase n=1 Tax=Vibrio inusitatus NBRC 102082 TaxID=1219070 RepID=A0A4Y3HYT7_9VIBR|nr:hypothetical protein [Vibrio inusitatus]GEA52296.1 hypothetical protein VIN01S_31000 [Vibrio inusitatus NBRC 102082]
MTILKKYFLFILVLIVPPCRFKNWILRLFGCDVAQDASIGFLLFFGKFIKVGEKSKLGSFSYYGSGVEINVHKNTNIGHFNVFSGDFCLTQEEGSVISNFVQIKNGGTSVIPEKSFFHLGDFTKITSKHYFDVSCSIVFGSNCVVGGRDSQFWTHGFLHQEYGSKRYISLNSIKIDDGVYIASRVLINPGTHVEYNVNILAGSVVSGHIKAGLVVASSGKKVIMDLKEKSIDELYHIDFDYKCKNPRLLTKKGRGNDENSSC